MSFGKSRASRLRLRLKEQGFFLRKSRNRSWPRPDDHCEYMVLDLATGFPVFGWHYDSDLEEVDSWLAEIEREAA
jgi:hypothetical protein